MSMTDPIADLLTRIRNGLQAHFATVDAPASRVKEDICKVLQSEGFIHGYERKDEGPQGLLRLTLKYTGSDEPVIQGLKRVSKPSLRTYIRAREIQQVRSGLGISIMTTSQGVMSGKEARKRKLGGEVICEIW